MHSHHSWKRYVKNTHHCMCDNVYCIHTQPVEALEENQAGRMSTERCVHLMLIGMANRLKELWISPHPVLLFTYIMQYFPNIALM